MTLASEAKLAREAEICYADVSIVTDFDAWKEGEETSNDKVIAVSSANVLNCKKIVKNLTEKLITREIKCSCSKSLQNAFMTSFDKIKESPNYESLSLFLNKYCK
jgi:5'-methylthioadenosine phosphorylase